MNFKPPSRPNVLWKSGVSAFGSQEIGCINHVLITFPAEYGVAPYNQTLIVLQLNMGMFIFGVKNDYK